MSAQAHARTRTRSGTRKRPTKAQRQRRRKLLRRRLLLLGFALARHLRARHRDRAAVRRQGRAGDLAPAAPRGHHPPAGGRQGPGPVADRRRDLRRVALPRPDLDRGRQGPDADPALDGGLHRPQVGRHGLRAGRSRDPADQHRLRLLVPALPAAALPRQRAAGARRLQRGRGQGRRVVPRRVRARRGLRGGDAHPVPRDPQLRGLGARGAHALPRRIRTGAGSG